MVAQEPMLNARVDAHARSGESKFEKQWDTISQWQMDFERRQFI